MLVDFSKYVVYDISEKCGKDYESIYNKPKNTKDLFKCEKLRDKSKSINVYVFDDVEYIYLNNRGYAKILKNNIIKSIKSKCKFPNLILYIKN